MGEVLQHADGTFMEAGFRPNPSLTGEDRLGAMDNHLQDMRQIAFTTLEIEQPKKGR